MADADNTYSQVHLKHYITAAQPIKVHMSTPKRIPINAYKDKYILSWEVAPKMICDGIVVVIKWIHTVSMP